MYFTGLLYFMCGAMFATEFLISQGVPTGQESVEKSTAIVVTNEPRLIMIRDDRILVNTKLPDMQVPVQTAVNGYATMSVINGVLYIGGINGTVYKIHVSGSASKDQLSVSVSNVSFGIPCHIETFIDDDGATAICFSNVANVLDIIKVDTTPFESNKHSFKSSDFISNIVKLNDKVIYMRNNTLFKANINEGHTIIETIDNCELPLLAPNTNLYIIVNCTGSNKSEVYVPLEWGDTDTFGIRNGAWKNKNRFLDSCYGTGFAILVYMYSRENKVVTFYNIYNIFEYSISLNGTPNGTLTCVLEENYLILIVKDESCNCRMVHVFDENFDYLALFPILDSDGDLLPLVVNNETIDQNVLIFQEHDHVQYVMIPSTSQMLFDVAANTSISNITDDVILFHELAPLRLSSVTNKDQSTSSSTKNGNWGVYVGVAVLAVVILMIVIHMMAGGIIVQYRERRGSIRVGKPVQATGDGM